MAPYMGDGAFAPAHARTARHLGSRGPIARDGGDDVHVGGQVLQPVRGEALGPQRAHAQRVGPRAALVGAGVAAIGALLGARGVSTWYIF